MGVAAARGNGSVTVTYPDPIVVGAPGYLTPENQTLAVGATQGLLSGSRPSSDPLTAELTATPAHGVVAVAPDGSFAYTPNAGFSGADTFTFEALDASGNYATGLVTVTVAATPGAPTAVVATAASGSATVSFLPPSADGGAPISRYTVTAQPGGQVASGSASPITLGGLTPGTTYTFSVAAINAAGQGAASTPSAPLTIAAAAPTAAAPTALPVASPLSGGSAGGSTIGTGNPGGDGGVKSHTLPALSRASLLATAFTAASGTRLELVLSAPATVHVVVKQSFKGREVGGRCRQRAAHGRECTGIANKATIAFSAPAGARSFVFRPRGLAAGSYSATITATNAEGSASKTVTLNFQIKRRHSGG